MDGRKWRTVHKHGPKRIKEDLECTEEGFAEQRVKQKSFKGRGEVGVEARDAEGFVVREMVGLHNRICISVSLLNMGNV